MTTLSIIKADTGGFVGHSSVHPEMLATAREAVRDAVGDGLLLDGTVSCCGDDVSLIMTHEHGADAEAVHSFAWDTFLRTTEVAKRLGLYGAGQDLLSDAFSGNLRGMGPGYADPSFDRARAQANKAMDYLRRHGPFEPHRLPLEDLEYTTMRQLEHDMADRWEPLAVPEPVVPASRRG